MSNNSFDNLGSKISNSVRSALKSGDLSQLKDIGPAVQQAVKDIPVINPTQYNNANTPQTPPSAPAAPRSPATQGNAAPAWFGKGSFFQGAGQGPPKSTGVAAVILGTIGIICTGVFALLFGVSSIFISSVGTVLAAGISGTGLLACIGVFANGIKNNRLAKRVRQYYLLLQQNKQVQTISNLALQTGEAEVLVRKNVKKAMRKNMMPDVYVDQGATCLMQGKEAHQLYLESVQTQAERETAEAARLRRKQDPATAGIESFREEGSATIAKIRAANDAIPGEEISQKLSDLELTTAKIFAYVQKHPAKLPDTRRFLNYYLPTTLKLVEKYRQYDKMDLEITSVQTAKTEIENALDNINVAFVNLLSDLYKEDTLDISTDIEVLQSVLEQEGLTGKTFDLNPEDTSGTPPLSL